METHNDRIAPEALSKRVKEGANAQEIAGAVVQIWQETEEVLHALIGYRGIAALYQRSLYLTSATHPWLMPIYEGVQTAMNLPALNTLLSQQSAATARSGGTFLLQTFYELLTSLVGPSLTERLLRSVWANSLSGSSAQDSSL